MVTLKKSHNNLYSRKRAFQEYCIPMKLISEYADFKMFRKPN